MMKKMTHRILMFVVFAVFTVSAIQAQPRNDQPGNGRGPDKVKQEKRQGGGPPPWAPAHGYRHSKYREYGLTAVPIEIDRGRCNREVMGQVLGGATGAYVGSQIGGNETERLFAVAAGTFVGMMIGGEIGRSLDKVDRLCIDQALELAPDGGRITWNDDTRQYAMTPEDSYQDREGRYCREYQMVSEIDGRSQQVTGTACRQTDGTWQLNP